MNKEFNRMQKLAGIISEGLYTTQIDVEGPVAEVSNDMEDKPRMTKEEFKSKIREMILAEKSLNEAKKDKKGEEAPEEEVAVDIEAPVEPVADIPTDTSVDLDGDGTSDIDAGSSEAKKAFGDLTDAFQAAKTLGDEKLIRQIANTITYFNKNIILKQG